MSKDTLPTNEQIAQYLDNDVPLQQLDQPADAPSFMNAQLAFAKSKHGKAGKRKKAWYQHKWHNKGGNNE